MKWWGGSERDVKEKEGVRRAGVVVRGGLEGQR